MNKLISKLLAQQKDVKRYAYNGSAAMLPFLLLFVFVGVSCTKETPDVQGGFAGGETHVVTIALSQGLDNVVDVKADDYSSYLTDVRNLWIVQLSTDGKTQLARPVYTTSLQKQNDIYGCQLPLMDGQCQLILLANTDDPNLIPDEGNSYDAISQLTYLSSAIRDASVAPPSCAIWNGRIDGPTTIRAELKRSSALLDLTIDATDLPEIYTLKINRIDIDGCAERVRYVVDDESDKLPNNMLLSGFALTRSEQDITNNVFKTVVGIPPAPAGTGTSSTPYTKNRKNTPAGNTQSCLSVLVQFTLDTQDGSYAATEVVQIYLGQDAKNDYNVFPGDVIQVVAKIKDFKRFDLRISEGSRRTIYEMYPCRWSTEVGNTTPIQSTREAIIHYVLKGQVPTNPAELRAETEENGNIGAYTYMNNIGEIIAPAMVVRFGNQKLTLTPQIQAKAGEYIQKDIGVGLTADLTTVKPAIYTVLGNITTFATEKRIGYLGITWVPDQNIGMLYGYYDHARAHPGGSLEFGESGGKTWWDQYWQKPDRGKTGFAVTREEIGETDQWEVTLMKKTWRNMAKYDCWLSPKRGSEACYAIETISE